MINEYRYHFKMGSRLFRAKSTRPLARDVERFRRRPDSEQGTNPTAVPASDTDENEVLLKRLNTVYVEIKRSTAQVSILCYNNLKHTLCYAYHNIMEASILQ